MFTRTTNSDENVEDAYEMVYKLATEGLDVTATSIVDAEPIRPVKRQ